jgi:MFS family permease
MKGGRSLGRPFAWLWSAYAVSTFGTWIAFDAFALIAVIVLHAPASEVSLLAAAGLAAGALIAVPMGPWTEYRRKRPVMVAMDLIRFLAIMSIPASFALGCLRFAQLLIVSIIVTAASVTFRAASGAYLKSLVRAEDLLIANARLESTTWTATALGPPLGGAAISMFGPVATVSVDALSYLFSAAGLSAMRGQEPTRAQVRATSLSFGDLIEGWRHILSHPALRPLFFNTLLVNGLIMATAPLIAVLMLGRLGFAPWQYGLAFGAPCIGGFIGARLAPPLVARFGRRRIMLAAGVLRACWSIGLVFVRPGIAGLVLVIAVQLGIVTSAGVFNAVFAAFRLDHTSGDRVARTLSAWSITGNVATAALTASWGVLAAVTSLRAAIGIAGLLMLATPLLLVRRRFGTAPSPAARVSA